MTSLGTALSWHPRLWRGMTWGDADFPTPAFASHNTNWKGPRWAWALAPFGIAVGKCGTKTKRANVQCGYGQGVFWKYAERRRHAEVPVSRTHVRLVVSA